MAWAHPWWLLDSATVLLPSVYGKHPKQQICQDAPGRKEPWGPDSRRKNDYSFDRFSKQSSGIVFHQSIHCMAMAIARTAAAPCAQVPAAPWHLEQSVERLVSWSSACGAASVSVGPRGGDGFKVEGHGVVTMLCPTSRWVTEIFRAACPRHDLRCGFCSDGAIGESITLYRRL